MTRQELRIEAKGVLVKLMTAKTRRGRLDAVETWEAIWEQYRSELVADLASIVDEEVNDEPEGDAS